LRRREETEVLEARTIADHAQPSAQPLMTSVGQSTPKYTRDIPISSGAAIPIA
jgi:hypothetical protein